ncbi:MAG: hypothetical protein WC806_06455, partial [Candidatus Gracilibacteria bacterium]
NKDELGMGIVKVDPEKVVEETETVDGLVKAPEEITATTDAAETPADVVPTTTPSSLGLPVVTSVAGVTTKNSDGFYEVDANPAVITGTASVGTEQVVVNTFVLKKFKAGDDTWSYFANSDYGLMKEGENVYEVYAIDKDGKKTASVTVKVLYKPKVVAPVETPAADTPVVETPATTDTSTTDASTTPETPAGVVD